MGVSAEEHRPIFSTIAGGVAVIQIDCQTIEDGCVCVRCGYRHNRTDYPEWSKEWRFSLTDVEMHSRTAADDFSILARKKDMLASADILEYIKKVM